MELEEHAPCYLVQQFQSLGAQIPPALCFSHRSRCCLWSSSAACLEGRSHHQSCLCRRQLKPGEECLLPHDLLPFRFLLCFTPQLSHTHDHGSNYKSQKESQCPGGILHSCSLKQPRTNCVINWQSMSELQEPPEISSPCPSTTEQHGAS